jgi:hypothetical protein
VQPTAVRALSCVWACGRLGLQLGMTAEPSSKNRYIGARDIGVIIRGQRRYAHTQESAT